MSRTDGNVTTDSFAGAESCFTVVALHQRTLLQPGVLLLECDCATEGAS